MNPPAPVVNESKARFLSMRRNATALSYKAAASSFVPNSSAVDGNERKVEQTAANINVLMSFMIEIPSKSE